MRDTAAEERQGGRVEGLGTGNGRAPSRKSKRPFVRAASKERRCDEGPGTRRLAQGATVTGTDSFLSSVFARVNARELARTLARELVYYYYCAALSKSLIWDFAPKMWSAKPV